MPLLLRYLDLLSGFAVCPEEAVPEIRERPPFGLGLLCFMISGVSLFLAQSLGRRFLLLPPGPISLAIICFCRLAIGVLMTGLLHLFAELGGGQGKALGLFVFLGISDLVWALALPLVLILKAMGLGNSLLAIWGVLTLLGFASFALRAWGLRENYHLDLGRAWVLVCIPYAVSVLLTMTFISLVVFEGIVSFVRLLS